MLKLIYKNQAIYFLTYTERIILNSTHKSVLWYYFYWKLVEEYIKHIIVTCERYIYQKPIKYLYSTDHCVSCLFFGDFIKVFTTLRFLFVIVVGNFFKVFRVRYDGIVQLNQRRIRRPQLLPKSQTDIRRHPWKIEMSLRVSQSRIVFAQNKKWEGRGRRGEDCIYLYLRFVRSAQLSHFHCHPATERDTYSSTATSSPLANCIWCVVCFNL